MRIMMRLREPDTIVWRKSSYSGGNGDCVEVASTGAAYLVRDSKNPQWSELALPETGWRGLLSFTR
jgi:hypothetical protein